MRPKTAHAMTKIALWGQAHVHAPRRRKLPELGPRRIRRLARRLWSHDYRRRVAAESVAQYQAALQTPAVERQTGSMGPPETPRQLALAPGLSPAHRRVRCRGEGCISI